MTETVLSPAEGAAIVAITRHVTGEEELPPGVLGDALVLLGETRPWGDLGRALWVNLLRANIHRLQARRDALLRQVAALPKPAVH